MTAGPWTPTEDTFLSENYQKMSGVQIASALGRTPGSVKAAGARLGLRKRIRAADLPTPRPGHGYCVRCREEKPLVAFHSHRGRRSGRQERCADCRLEMQRERLYGISEEEYQALLAAQGGVCAICHQPETNTYRGRVRRLAVDHDHRTGERRALLCSDCNVLLGHADDQPERLEAAAAYLRQKRAKSLGLTNVIPDSWNS